MSAGLVRASRVARGGGELVARALLAGVSPGQLLAYAMACRRRVAARGAHEVLVSRCRTERISLTQDTLRHLAWFLGPKAENAPIVEDLLLLILRDYMHWRKNYFPVDPLLMTKELQRAHVHDHDRLNQHVHELMAELRRNFPFYSPRYIAHQLSDTLIPGMLGYFAGSLFNANNVTPEAAPVTTHLEVEACNAVLEMLGYRPPPQPPPQREDVHAYYERHLREEFGWAHITSGGTIANIEALWVARQVRAVSLAIQDTSRRHHLDVSVKLPSERERRVDIAAVSAAQLLLIKPNEAVYLLTRFVEAVRVKRGLGIAEANEASRISWTMLHESQFSPARGVGAFLAASRPVILTAGTRHYSLAKAADILGIGRENIRAVRTDPQFRMHVPSLRQAIIEVIREGGFPLCVVAAAGTTEEGSVDPIHDILDLRADLEARQDASFWLHVDAAWGGFMRSLFCFEPAVRSHEVRGKVGRALSLPDTLEPAEWHARFALRVHTLVEETRESTPLTSSDAAVAGGGRTNATAHRPLHLSDSDDGTDLVAAEDDGAPEVDELERYVRRRLKKMETFLMEGNLGAYVDALEKFPGYFRRRGAGELFPEDCVQLGLGDYLRIVGQYVSASMAVPAAPAGALQVKQLRWPTSDVCAAFLGFPKADSITVDPHKMRYVAYPSGCIAFRNDRVRLFVQQHAPYLTAGEHSPLMHRPPRHAKADGEARAGARTTAGASHRVQIDSFSPFIVEGSKPGAAAAALWLAIKTVPLTMHAHGEIVRSSLLAARQVYEWLTRWNSSYDSTKEGLDYQFLSLTERVPDSNLVTFLLKKKTSASLSSMNRLTQRVYEHFTILAELGEMEYSYSQPFFLSRNVFRVSDYPADCLRPFFERGGIANWREDYPREGLVILRAAVMSPYFLATKTKDGSPLVSAFLRELADAASFHVRDVER